MRMPKRRVRVSAALSAATLVLLAGCGSGSSSQANTSAAAGTIPGGPQVSDADFSRYDVYVVASAQNNRLFSDVYGIRFDGLGAERLTTNKRISTLTADDSRVVVAAADAEVDRLALLANDGELGPIPGLGRPFAFAPKLRDGVIFFHDAEGEDSKGKFRYYAWDVDRQAKSLNFQTAKSVGSAQPLGGGRFLVSTADGPDSDNLAVRTESGKLTEYPVDGLISELAPGRSYLAATLVNQDAQFGNQPEALALVDRESGKVTRVPGLALVAWSPDGAKLIARRTDSTTESKLVLLDPAKPSTFVDLGTVPGLVIYSGVWVRGNATPAG